MAILDSSTALEILLRTPVGARAEHMMDAWDFFHVPHLLDIEFVHVLRRMARVKAISPREAEQALDDLADLRLIRHDHGPLLPRIWELRNALSGYDAAYIALAETLGLPLLTCDAKLARSHGHRAHIILLPEPT